MKKWVLLLFILPLLFACTNKETTPSLSFEIEGELPDIGSFSKDTVKTYFFEGVTSEFVPSDSYGKIMPFIGNVKKYTPRDEHGFPFGYSFNSYGFCTADGRIIADVNPRISLVEHRFEDEFGLYVVTEQTGFDKCLEFTDTKVWITPEDGSWKIDLGVNGGVYDVMAGLIFTRNFDKGLSNPAAVYVYDYDGKLVFTFDEKYMFMSASCGRILVRDRDDERYYFLSYDGEKLLGPYDRTFPFNFAGFTYALFDDGLYYIIDTDGNVMSSKGYRNIEMFEDYDKSQSAFVCYNNDKNMTSADILSSRGEFIATVDNDGAAIENVLLFFTDERGIIYTHNNWYASFKYLDSGERFYSKLLNVCPNSLETFGGYFFYRNDINGKGVLFDQNGDTVVSSDSMDYIVAVSLDKSTIIYREEKGVKVFDNINKTYLYDIPYENAYAAPTKDERYLNIVDSDGKTAIYDLEKGDFILSGKDYIYTSVIDGKTYFSYVGEGVSTLCDDEGNVLIRTFIE